MTHRLSLLRRRETLDQFSNSLPQDAILEQVVRTHKVQRLTLMPSASASVVWRMLRS